MSGAGGLHFRMTLIGLTNGAFIDRLVPEADIAHIYPHNLRGADQGGYEVLAGEAMEMVNTLGRMTQLDIQRSVRIT